MSPLLSCQYVELLLSFNSSSNSSHITTKYVTTFCAVPSQDVADKISTSLLSEKLVACVNTIPGIKSSYWWEGKIAHDQELLLMMKTRSTLISMVTDKIKKLHPYDVPEVIFQPIVAGNDKYLEWIGESTQQSSMLD